MSGAQSRGPFIRIDSRDDIPRAIALMQQAGAGHRVPLLQAVYRGRIAFLEMQRPGASGLFKRWSAMIRVPGIVLVGDDDDIEPAGPTTWPGADRLFRWSRFTMIHGGAGAPSHYEHAIDLAEQHGRVLLIESRSRTIEAWRAAAERASSGARGLVLTPPAGCVHPTPPCRAGMN